MHVCTLSLSLCSVQAMQGAGGCLRPAHLWMLACGPVTAAALGRQDTLRLTRPALLAWLERRLRPHAPGGEADQLAFAAWLRARHAAGELAFSFKEPMSGAAGAGEQTRGNIVGFIQQGQHTPEDVPASHPLRQAVLSDTEV
jgi:hypothetical protein